MRLLNSLKGLAQLHFNGSVCYERRFTEPQMLIPLGDAPGIHSGPPCSAGEHLLFMSKTRRTYNPQPFVASSSARSLCRTTWSVTLLRCHLFQEMRSSAI